MNENEILFAGFDKLRAKGFNGFIAEKGALNAVTEWVAAVEFEADKKAKQLIKNLKKFERHDELVVVADYFDERNFKQRYVKKLRQIHAHENPYVPRAMINSIPSSYESAKLACEIAMLRYHSDWVWDNNEYRDYHVASRINKITNGTNHEHQPRV